MSTTVIDNLAIRASAGTGKTYQLAMRYIRLLAEGFAPDQVCAMTFSRKAAAEILDAIVENLCLGAKDDEGARKLAGDIGKSDLRAKDFLGLLRVLLDNLQQSHISTLDSFTVSVIRAFPMELGISTDLQLMDNDGAAARLARYQLLSRVFNHRLTSQKVQTHFHEAFKEATFGREEGDMFEPLNTFIQKYWAKFRRLPHPEAWGNADLIWPGGCKWLTPAMKVAAAASELREIIEKREFPHGSIVKGLIKLLEALAASDVTKPLDKSISGHQALCQLLQVNDLANAKNATISYYKEFSIGGNECRLWSVLIEHCFGIELLKRLRETAGIGRLLGEYANLYERFMRSGQMTFEDAQYLLTSENSSTQGDRVSRNPANRLYIDYRLNCRLDHWLLDEFQDTSNLQWEVVSNLVNEVMMDDSGLKKLFFVGDVKQAVHGWRGGNAKLFGKVLSDYKGMIKEQDLSASYRSCQPVLDMVNRAFQELPDSVSSVVRERWASLWSDHRVADGRTPKKGYGALLEAVPTGDKGKCLAEDRYRVVAQLLRRIDPIARGLTVAILMRKHDTSKALVDLLRRECPEIAICHEGRANICDNPVVAVLLSLVRSAAHPGNTMAYQHLLMSPLRAHIESEDLSPGRLSREVLEEIQEDGFEPTVRRWGARLSLDREDHFGRKRVDDLAAAAAVFDQGDSRDCGDFVTFIMQHETEEAGTDASVNVMTVHKSKGIGRDVIILPDLESAFDTTVDLALPAGPETEKVSWALRMPVKMVADAEKTLGAVKQELFAEKEFEDLCAMYVALTRAKRANYVVVGTNSPPSSSAAILKARLVGKTAPSPWEFDEETPCLYETGDRDWHEEAPLLEHEEARAIPVLSRDFHGRESLRPHLVRREPSKLRAPTRSAASLFNREDTDVMDFGSAIHQLFEKVQWAEDADVDAIIEQWAPTSAYGDDVTNDVITQFRACMKSDAVLQYLSRPETECDEPWIEKSFDIVLKGDLVSGAFDRVIVMRDKNGNLESATIIDYKSSRVDREEDIDRKAIGYAPQMTTYRAALSSILGIPEEKIELCLLFTRRAVTRLIS